jgi:hypothetical protein
MDIAKSYFIVKELRGRYTVAQSHEHWPGSATVSSLTTVFTSWQPLVSRNHEPWEMRGCQERNVKSSIALAISYIVRGPMSLSVRLLTASCVRLLPEPGAMRLCTIRDSIDSGPAHRRKDVRTDASPMIWCSDDVKSGEPLS